MYSNEMTKISGYFDDDPRSVLLGAVKFTLATIQQAFHTVPAALDEWDDLGSNAPTMWGWKPKGCKFIEKNATSMAALLTTCKREGDVIGAIDLLMMVPGLGTVKASFVAQILGFEVGCIDGHNATMYKINVNSFKCNPKHTAKTKLAKITAYVALCEALGGAEHLWDTWCELIAIKQRKHFNSAEHVSELHSTLVLRYVR
jgi:hypothetical protein